MGVIAAFDPSMSSGCPMFFFNCASDMYILSLLSPSQVWLITTLEGSLDKMILYWPTCGYWSILSVSLHSRWLGLKAPVDMTARHMSGVAPRGALVTSGLWCHSIGEPLIAPHYLSIQSPWLICNSLLRRARMDLSLLRWGLSLTVIFIIE